MSLIKIEEDKDGKAREKVGRKKLPNLHISGTKIVYMDMSKVPGTVPYRTVFFFRFQSRLLIFGLSLKKRKRFYWYGSLYDTVPVHLMSKTDFFRFVQGIN